MDELVAPRTAARELRAALSILLEATEAKLTRPDLDISDEIGEAQLVLQRTAVGFGDYLRPDVLTAYRVGLDA